METGFEKLFVRRGHPSDDVIDGELFDGVTWQYCYRIRSQNTQLTF